MTTVALFTHAGVSRLDGSLKVRFANDAGRVGVLAKHGHKDIDIIEIREPMSKTDAVAYLLKIQFDVREGVSNAEVLAALHAAADKRGITVEKPAAEVAETPVLEDEPAVEETVENQVEASAPKARVRNAKGHFVKA